MITVGCEYQIKNHKLDRTQKAFLKNHTFHGNEIVAGTRRLCLMNLFLHNIGEIDGESCVSAADALIAQPSQTLDLVLANPPFGKKSSMTFTNEEGEQERDDLTYNRQDFWATTSNKQLNFLQHIRSMLKTTGRAAVVLPDNVLFEGGAGETVRKKLLETTELHTILRLPTGIFYAQGVKANVLFFDNRPASKSTATKDVWYYDYRTNIHHTLKRKTLRLEDLREFITCYNPAKVTRRVAEVNASENLRKPKISARVAELRKPQTETALLTKDRKQALLMEFAENPQIKTPDRLRAIELDAKLAGHFAPDVVTVDDVPNLLDEIKDRANRVASILNRRGMPPVASNGNATVNDAGHTDANASANRTGQVNGPLLLRPAICARYEIGPRV